MRYFIEVKAVAQVYYDGEGNYKPQGKIHLEGKFRDWENKSRCGTPFCYPVDAPVTCKRCLAILEKQGRVEE